MSNTALLRGGCDLLLLSRLMKTKVDTEFNWVKQGTTFRQDHSEFVLGSYHPALKRIPFLHPRAYETEMFSGKYDFVIYSCLIDFGQARYEHKATGTRFAAFGRYTDLTNPTQSPSNVIRKVTAKYALDASWLKWFKENFTYLGGHTPESFSENILKIRSKLPESTKLILLNGSEVPGPFDATSQKAEPKIHTEHCKLNTAAEQLAKTPGIELCDVRQYATKREHHTNNIRHYRRQVLTGLAIQLDKMCST